MKAILLSFVVFFVFTPSFGLPTQQSLRNEEGSRNNLIENGFKEISELPEDVSNDEAETSSPYEPSTIKNEYDVEEVDAIDFSTTTDGERRKEYARIETDATESTSSEVNTETEEIIENMFDLNESNTEESSEEESESVNKDSSEESLGEEEEEKEEAEKGNLKLVDITPNLVKLEHENNSKETTDGDHSEIGDNKSIINDSNLLYNAAVINRFGIAHENLETTAYSGSSSSDDTSVTSETDDNKSISQYSVRDSDSIGVTHENLETTTYSDSSSITTSSSDDISVTSETDDNKSINQYSGRDSYSIGVTHENLETTTYSDSSSITASSSDDTSEIDDNKSIIQYSGRGSHSIGVTHENLETTTYSDSSSSITSSSDDTSVTSEIVDDKSIIQYNAGLSNSFGSTIQNLESTTYSDSISDDISVTSEEISVKGPSTVSNSNIDETTTRFSLTTSQYKNIPDSVSASTEGSSVSTKNAWYETDKVITIGARNNINTESDSPSTTSNVIDSTEKITTANSISNIAIDTTGSNKDFVTIDKTTSSEFYKNDNDYTRTSIKNSITIVNEPTSTVASSIRGESSRSFDLTDANQYDIFSGIKTTTPSEVITEKPKVSFIYTPITQDIVRTQSTSSPVEILNRLGAGETTTVQSNKVSLASNILPPKLNSESKSETSTNDGLVKAVFTGEVILDDPMTDVAPRKGFFFNFQSLGAYNLASLTRNSYSSLGRTTSPPILKTSQRPRVSNKKNGEHMPAFSLGIINKYTGSDMQIDTINLGKTGSINRLDSSKSMFFKGYHIHQPTYGKYL